MSGGTDSDDEPFEVSNKAMKVSELKRQEIIKNMQPKPKAKKVILKKSKPVAQSIMIEQPVERKIIPIPQRLKNQHIRIGNIKITNHLKVVKRVSDFRKERMAMVDRAQFTKK